MMKTIAAATALIAMAGVAGASEYDAALEALAEETIAPIVADPALIAAIKAQNAEHAALTQAEIDALDTDWRAQVGASPAPLIDAVSAKPASVQLAAVRDESEGLFTEIFAMDDKGLNVAVSDVTSDYWQGDEAKWRESFGVGAGGVHIGDGELDESTQTYQAQVSVAVVDPETNAPIGAVTFGVNVEMIE